MIFNQNQKLKNVFIRFLDLSRNWSIAKKISYGYAVAIGIAIIGTTNGLLIASYYEQISQKQLRLSSQQQLLLKNLELGVTSLRIHPQKLVSVLDNTIWLEFEQNQFLDEMAAVNKHLTEVKTFIIKHSNHLIINSEDFQKLLDNYENTIKLYNQ